MVDLDAAIERSKAEGKPVLAEFTGSDWCVHCQELEDEVLSQPAFLSQVGRLFVLLRLDDPQDPALLPAAQRAKNRELADRYRVRGYPTLVLLDSEARPFARTGARDGDWSDYLSHLIELHTLGEDVAAARGAVAKAADPEAELRARDRLLGLLGRSLAMDCYRDEVDRMVAADADGALGLAAKYGAWIKGAGMQDVLLRHMGKGDWAGLVRSMDEHIEVFRAAETAELLQEALFFRAAGLMELEDYAEALAAYEAARDAAPGTSTAAIVEARFLPMVRRSLERK